MAPIPRLLSARRTYNHYYNSGGGTNSGGIGGGVVAAIIAVVLVVFICVYISEFNKQKRIHTRTGAPISYSKCFKKAILIALTLGLVSCLCAECCGLDDGGNGNAENAGNGGNGGGPQMMDQAGGGFVQQPMPSYQPQMDWTPVDAAATAPVQG